MNKYNIALLLFDDVYFDPANWENIWQWCRWQSNQSTCIENIYYIVFHRIFFIQYKCKRKKHENIKSNLRL